jgi:Ca-activated chloride channel family protein
MIEAIRSFFEVDASDGAWAASGWLGWLVLVVGLMAVALLTGWRHARVVRKLFSGAMADRVRPPSVVFRRTLRDVFALTALGLAIVALAGPRCDKRVQLLKASGVDLVLVVDLSRSMDATDVDPSRLERARREIYDLLEILEADRVGLVVFAGGAYPRMPMTEDHEALRMLVEEMSTNDFQAQGSALDLALTTAAKLLQMDEESRAGKAILVLSDGELHDVPPALSAAAEVRDQGIRIYTMGIGDAAAPIPLGNGNWQMDRGGRQVLTTPSPQTLRDLARVGGGAYVDSTPGAADIQDLFRREIRGTVEAGLRATRPKVTWTPLWGWPLGIAVALALVAGWLGEGRARAWNVVAMLVVAGAFAFADPAFASTLAEGDAAFRGGRYPDAVRVFTELVQEEPSNPELYGRLAAARYRAGDYEGAARAWERQAELEDRGGVQALYNAGNAHARAGRLEEAVERYDEVLSLQDHPAAKANREMVAQELTRRRSAQPPPPPESSSSSKPNSGDPDKKPAQDRTTGPDGQPQPQPGEKGRPEENKGTNEPMKDPNGESGQEQPGGGSDNGPRERSDRDQAGENPTQQSGGRKQTSDSQERLDESDVDGVRPQDMNTDGSDGPTAGTVPGKVEGGIPGGPATEAEKMLEGVREGRPRITIPGRSDGKPW